MKPGPRDREHRMVIEGLTLSELKRHAWDMPASYGLERKIQQYKGKRPLVLYRWDLECLIAVLDAILKDPQGYACFPARGSNERWRLSFVSHDDPRCAAIKDLFERLCHESREAYGEDYLVAEDE